MRQRDQLLTKRAAHLRHEATPFEIMLWRHLSRSQLAGHKFRRQAVIGAYIVDFFCPAKNLAVEVDGDTHDPARDAFRDTKLANSGVRTIRFTNADVAHNMEGVVFAIAVALDQQPDRWPHPNPVAGDQCPALIRSCRGHDRPATPEGEGLTR